jgi:3'(2'), 5'-bisphosphate nucleotidase
MEITDQLISMALRTAFKAGKAIMNIYQQPYSIEYKADNSPLTLADKAAHYIINQALAETGLPVLSEEGSQTDYEIRKNWLHFWLVDPLDGTKEFINKNGDFTVNIALISNHQPVLGIVFAPVPGIMYWGSPAGSFRLDISLLEENDFDTSYKVFKSVEKLPCISRTGGLIVLGSRSHMNEETQSYIDSLQKLNNEISFVSRGSSLKFCTLAEGGADVYPRFGPTMEWDTAAGHAVAFYAGCTVLQAGNGRPLEYNKPSLLNPFFIAEQKK